MNQVIAWLQLLVVAGFAGGCLCLSVTCSGLLGASPLEAARIMHVLLPRMGAIMAPLLVAGCLGCVYLAMVCPHPAAHAPRWVFGAVGFLLIGVITARVHLPINAQLLAEQVLPAEQARALVTRWLAWHHVRSGLALLSLVLLLWPLRTYALPQP